MSLSHVKRHNFVRKNFGFFNLGQHLGQALRTTYWALRKVAPFTAFRECFRQCWWGGVAFVCGGFHTFSGGFTFPNSDFMVCRYAILGDFRMPAKCLQVCGFGGFSRTRKVFAGMRFWGFAGMGCWGFAGMRFWVIFAYPQMVCGYAKITQNRVPAAGLRVCCFGWF